MGNEVTGCEIVKNSAEYQTALNEVQKKDIFAIFLYILAEEGRMQHSRKVTTVQTLHRYIDAQQNENDKTVASKKESNKWLDSAGVVCMFCCGMMGGQAAAHGGMWYAGSQACDKASQAYSTANQAKSTASEFTQSRFGRSVDEVSQAKQSADRGFKEHLDTLRRITDAYQRVAEAAAAA